jgi:hypothetical protein
MELSSHVTTNLLEMLSKGSLDNVTYAAVWQLMSGAVQDAYDAGLAAGGEDDGSYHAGVDDGYNTGLDDGYDTGYNAAQAEFDTKRDEWFEQGWAEALLEHGIEE